MNKKNQFRMAVLSCALLTASFAANADDAGSKKSYGDKFLDKATHGLANVTTGWLEIPKNIYNMTRETNAIYGVIGGTGMGVFRTVGRTGVGVFDLITAPIPTDHLVHPGYIWDHFGTKTVYGVDFYLEEPVSRTAPQ
jgi:putative exosortase-associated protein (TIGR04073 family)